MALILVSMTGFETTLDDAHLAGIGRITVTAARLEYMQATITGALIGVDPSVREQLAPLTQSFSRLRALALSLATARFGPEGSHADEALAERIVDWHREVKETMDRRHAFVHGLWGRSGDGLPGYLSLRKPHRHWPVTIDDLDHLASQMAKLDAEGMVLAIQIAGAVLRRTTEVVDGLNRPVGGIA